MKTAFSPAAHLRGAILRLLLTLGLGLGIAGPAYAAQVQRITAANGDPIRYPGFLTEYAGQLFFRANNLTNGNNVELWAFDGSAARQVVDLKPGPTGSDPTDLTVCNGRLYFAANDGAGWKLWQYDLTNGAALAPGSESLPSLPQELFAYAGQLYFRAARFSDIGIELWKFDGRNQTPINLYPGSGSSYPQHFIEYDGRLYFNACGTPGQGTELWRFDGSGLPTEAARIYPNNGSSPENFAQFNGQLYFSAYDGGHGRELWRYDGSAAALAADLVPGGQYSSSNPSGLTEYAGKLYFCATDEVHGYELWAFDGTNAVLVADLNPTPDPGNGDTFLMDSNPGDLTVFAGRLYFAANDGVHGRELWSWDGTNVQLVLDLNPGPYGSEVSELTVFNGALYFSADDGYNPGLGSLQPEVFALAAPTPVPVRLSGQLSPVTGKFVLTVAAADASPLTTADLNRVQVFASADPLASANQWQPLTNQLVLNGGVIEIPDLPVTPLDRCFFRATISP